MSTQKQKTLTDPTVFNVGTINSWKVRTIANGAIVAATPIDNFTVVELSFNSDGERIATQLSDVKNKQYLIAAVERRYLDEQLEEFYNEVGERARIVIFDEGVRFETSAYTLNTGNTEVTKGDVAHFDPASKSYIVSASGSAHAGYATASTKFTVVGDEDDTAGNFNKSTIRLEVQ